MATFQVVTQNRYKLNKKYRKLLEQEHEDDDEDDVTGNDDEEKAINYDLQEAKVTGVF